jgi:threonine dehydratase
VQIPPIRNHCPGSLYYAAPSSSAAQPVVYLPETVDETKLARLRAIGGAEFVLCGRDCVVAERGARSHATRWGGVYVSPYNDIEVGNLLPRVGAEFNC